MCCDGVIGMRAGAAFVLATLLCGCPSSGEPSGEQCFDAADEADCDPARCYAIMAQWVDGEGDVRSGYVGCGGEGLACTTAETCARSPASETYLLRMGGPGCIPRGWEKVDGQDEACETVRARVHGSGADAGSLRDDDGGT